MAEGKNTEVVSKECLKELIEYFARHSTPYRARHVDRGVSEEVFKSVSISFS